eukprot:366044-Chlamydomonas_euryale.AAC.5
MSSMWRLRARPVDPYCRWLLSMSSASPRGRASHYFSTDLIDPVRYAPARPSLPPAVKLCNTSVEGPPACAPPPSARRPSAETPAPFSPCRPDVHVRQGDQRRRRRGGRARGCVRKYAAVGSVATSPSALHGMACRGTGMLSSCRDREAYTLADRLWRVRGHATFAQLA